MPTDTAANNSAVIELKIVIICEKYYCLVKIFFWKIIGFKYSKLYFCCE